jgi:hypothetical protein
VKILRTILWVLGAFVFLIFAIYNWKPAELTLWQNLVLETKLPVMVLLAFALGFLPLYAYHRSVTWGMSRRIRTLENSLKQAALARQIDTAAPGMTAAPADDKPVDKHGKDAGEGSDPLAPDSTSFDGGAK